MEGRRASGRENSLPVRAPAAAMHCNGLAGREQEERPSFYWVTAAAFCSSGKNGETSTQAIHPSIHRGLIERASGAGRQNQKQQWWAPNWQMSTFESLKDLSFQLLNQDHLSVIWLTRVLINNIGQDNDVNGEDGSTDNDENNLGAATSALLKEVIG